MEEPNPAFWPNLPHNHELIDRQINNGQMNGFASKYARKLDRTRGLVREGFLNDHERVLRFQTPDVAKTYARLARDYTICDRWFASVPAGTYPQSRLLLQRCHAVDDQPPTDVRNGQGSSPTSSNGSSRAPTGKRPCW